MLVFVIGIVVLFVMFLVFVGWPLGWFIGTVVCIRSGEVSFFEWVLVGGCDEIGVFIDGFNGLLEHIEKCDE